MNIEREARMKAMKLFTPQINDNVLPSIDKIGHAAGIIAQEIKKINDTDRTWTLPIMIALLGTFLTVIRPEYRIFIINRALYSANEPDIEGLKAFVELKEALKRELYADRRNNRVKTKRGIKG